MLAVTSGLLRVEARVATVGEIIVLALAIAASPFPVIPAILLLFTARPRPTSLAFLGAWLAAILVVAGVFTVFADLVGFADESPRWVAWLRICAGAALVAYGIVQWFARHASKDAPGWMQSIQGATPGSATRLAMLLSLANPKIVLLAAAGGLEIGAAELSARDELVTVLGFALLASMSVAIPVLGYAAVGESVLPPLAKARDWLLENHAAVMVVVIIAIGLVLLKNGISGL